MFGKNKDIIGVDIGSSAIKLVELKESRGNYTLKEMGMLPLPPEAIVDNALIDSAAVVETLRTLIKTLGVKVKDAVCSISGNAVIIRKISLPAMSQGELDEQIQWEAEQYIPFDISEVNLDFHILGPDYHDPTKMNVLLVASKKDIIDDYFAVFTEAGLKLTVVDVDSFAMQNAFEVNYAVGEEALVALINIGAGMMNLNLIKGGNSVFTRDVQTGGNVYTEEIQKQLGVSNDEAVKIKITGDHPQRAKLQEIFSRVNETMANEMKRSLDFYVSTAMDDRISRVYLTGGGASIPRLGETVSQKLGVPVEIMHPFRKVKFSEKKFDPAYIDKVGPLYSVAVGLATRRAGDK
jgi:type IV pilus assembly protein PilM